MKKLLLFACFVLPAAAMHAQAVDTILFADFETDPSTFIQTALPPGVNWDNNWYNVDIDGLPDGSGSGRPGEWFWTAPWAGADTLMGNTGVLGSSSWTNDPNNEVQNLLILPAIYIADTNATLSWSSAPYQTPRYLDGYQVLISTTDNDPSSFQDTLFVASEYTALNRSEERRVGKECR